MSLKIGLGPDGYREWEWFCKYLDNKDAAPQAIAEFKSIEGQLDGTILYRGYGQNGHLVEFKIKDLK